MDEDPSNEAFVLFLLEGYDADEAEAMETNCRQWTLLPNSSEETFLPPDGFLTELDPQVRLLTLPNFGVNICPFNYGIKVILFRN
jgi:hypothetical protein